MASIISWREKDIMNLKDTSIIIVSEVGVLGREEGEFENFGL